MKILRNVCMLTIVAGLVIGGAGSALAKGPPAGSLGKCGLFGTVTSVETITSGKKYIIYLETEQGIVHVTTNTTAKYMAPREIHGPKTLDAFVDAIDKNDDGDLEELEGRRLAILVINLVEGNPGSADAVRLMLIPITPPLHAHRVGIAQEGFTPGDGGSITIIDKDGVSHIFDIDDETVYRPEAISELAESSEPELITAITGGCVTVVTTGDPKQPENLIAKAIVLHDGLPE